VDQLSKRQVSFLSPLYSEDGYFNHDTTQADRVSILSTSMALHSILLNPELWAPETSGGSKVSIADIQQSLEDPSSKHTSDGSRLGNFRIPFLITALTSLKTPASSRKLQAVIAQTIVTVASATSRVLPDKLSQSTRDACVGACVGNAIDIQEILLPKGGLSMYLLYWSTRALTAAMLGKDSHGEAYISFNMIGDAKACQDRVAQEALDELCRQLAYHASGERSLFDVMQLSYALMLHYETSGYKGAMICGEDRTTVFNEKLSDKALEVIFGAQLANGLWPQGAPIDREGQSMRGDIGNSFVFSFDLIGSLLETFEATRANSLRPYLGHLEKSLQWAEDNLVESMVSSSCDLETSTSQGQIMRGWRSNHLGKGGPVTVCTAQVFIAVAHMRSLLKKLRNQQVLEEFKGVIAEAEPNNAAWARLMDADLEIGGKAASLKTVIDAKVIAPLVALQQTDAMPLILGQGVKAAFPKYSMILYGPPGTAKTTICTSIAEKLGWSFVTIDTACFLANGMEQVASRMTYIFERLRELEDTVILFDEIEEFCLDREAPGLSMESRMLTTAMLTQLNDLRRKQRSVFIVATNRLRSFDAAVTRPGRFDMILLVGTPAMQDRLKRIEKKLQAAGVADVMMRQFDVEQETVKEVPAMVIVQELFHSKWEEHIRFLNFAENEEFSDGVVQLIRSKKLAKESFSALLSQAMETATIQGPVRTEYLAGAKLSRA